MKHQVSRGYRVMAGIVTTCEKTRGFCVNDQCDDCIMPPGTRCESAPGNCPYSHKPLTKAHIAAKLRRLAAGMDELAAEMDYFGGFAEWSKHGREIAGAGTIARQWADAIEALGEGE